jgi:hypothetical protein
MCPDPRGEDTVSKEELSEILADATERTTEEIEQGADDIEIDPPKDADIVDIEE